MGATDQQVQMAVGSRFENIELVQLMVRESLTRLHLSDKDAGDIGLAVREAVANAIEHGNRKDPDKQVRIDVTVSGQEVEIRIADEGDGFNIQKIPDPRAAENLLRPDGRGILFMKTFMDEIDYTFYGEGGTVVTLRKRVGQDPADLTEEESG